MVTVFRYQHVRQKLRPSNASLNRSARRFGLHDAITTRTSQLGTNVLDDFETGRNVLQDFRDIFAKMLQLTSTVRTSFFPRKILPHFPWQVIGQRSSYRSHHRSARGSGFFYPSCFFGSPCFQFFQPQFQLFDLAIPLLRRAAELQATQFRDQQLQVFDFRIARSELLTLRKDFFLLCGELFLMREGLLTQRQDECL